MGQRGHGKSRGLYFFSAEKETKNHQLGTGFLYTTEYYQQLREESLLAIGCHI